MPSFPDPNHKKNTRKRPRYSYNEEQGLTAGAGQFLNPNPK